jgi:hypothetical protein
LAPLLQLELFQKLDEDTERIIAELKAGIASEVDQLEARRAG